uniref:PepP n=2 Tax=Staphylococcus epidermidis TaxID=1282 RepID=Q54122_STAEP|nr:S8 family serine peptidase [Staphylococcus epidermidis]CAA90024.1 PepP [Staphylococcus epidermidis]
MKSNHTYIKQTITDSILFIDSGCDFKHPELQDNIILKQSKSFVDDNISDYTGHGTQIISVLTGKHYISGFLPNINIVLYKVTNFYGKSKAIDIYKALKIGIKNNFKVINISFSGEIYDKKLMKKFQSIIYEAYKKNIVICWSSMNNLQKSANHGNKNMVPNQLEKVFKIGDLNYYNSVDFVAPGGETINGNELEEITTMIVANTRLVQKISDHYMGLPIGYTLNMGNSIATSYASGCFMLIISTFKNKNKRYPSINEIISLISKYDDKERNLIEITKRVIEDEIV